MFTPQMFLDVNSKIVEEMAPFGIRTALRAAAINIVRITRYSGEDANHIMEGVIACFGPAAKQPRPDFAAKVRGLDAEIRNDDVKEIINRWAAASNEFNSPALDVKLAFGSMLALELAASLVRHPREVQIVREILKMEMEAQFAQQLTYTGEPLLDYVRRENAALLAGYPETAATDLAPLALAALTILSRITQHSTAGVNMNYVEQVAVSIELLVRGYRTARKEVGGMLRDVVESAPVNAAIGHWSAAVSTFPIIEVAQTLSAFAIETLALIGGRLSDDDCRKLLDQVPAHMIGGGEVVVTIDIGD